MILVAPLPDELLRGVIGRIRLCNGFSTSSETWDRLRTLHEPKTPSGPPPSRLTVIASALQIDQPTCARLYSLLPASRAVVAEIEPAIHGDPRYPSILARSGLRIFERSANLCPDCIKEDDAFWGISYWRRSHQLPGVHWCHKHATILRKVTLPAPFDDLPGDVLIDSTELPPESAVMGHPVLMRYAEIMYGFLERDRPLQIAGVTTALRQRTNSVGLRIGAKGQRTLISDLALETIPPQWLRDNFPGVAAKSHLAFASSLDGVNISRTPHAASAYALAAALLWDSADEALYEISGSSGINHSPGRKLKIRGRQFWESDAALNLYVKHNGNIRKIAGELSANDRYVGTQLRKTGLVGLGGKKWQGLSLAMLACYAGNSIKSAAKAYGVDPVRLEKNVQVLNARLARALAEMIRHVDTQMPHARAPMLADCC